MIWDFDTNMKTHVVFKRYLKEIIAIILQPLLYKLRKISYIHNCCINLINNITKHHQQWIYKKEQIFGYKNWNKK